MDSGVVRLIIPRPTTLAHEIRSLAIHRLGISGSAGIFGFYDLAPESNPASVLVIPNKNNPLRRIAFASVHFPSNLLSADAGWTSPWLRLKVHD